MNQPPAPQTVLITGASSGIGEATAIALQKAGYTVYAAARRLERMQHLQKLGIHTISLDITDEASLQVALATITTEAGGVDILINNAGYGSYGSLEDVPMSEARRQIDVNLLALARLTQLVIPYMRANKRGTIINIASIGSHFGEPFGAWYHATKYAVAGLTDSLRLELKPFGIKVVTVKPGLIKTEWPAIAADNLDKVSGQGIYATAAKRKSDSLRNVYASKLTSSPEVVAQGIVKILRKSNPAFQYAIGGGARTVLFLRRFTPDRLFYYFLNR